jgi:hypothetical protein
VWEKALQTTGCSSLDQTLDSGFSFSSATLSEQFLTIQGDFERCACILTNGRTPQYGTIEPIMSYTQNWDTSQCTNLCKRCAASSLWIFLLSNTYLIPSKELYFFLFTYSALHPLFTRHHGLQTVLKPNNEA